MKKDKTDKSKQLWGKLKNLLLKEQKYVLEEKPLFQLLKREEVSEQNNLMSICKYTYCQASENNKQQNNSYILNGDISAKIIQQKKEISLKEIKNFNQSNVDSTGIQMWPAEEVLAYFCIKNISLFRNKSILEMGAGYSGLATILLAQYLLNIEKQENINILITDGNEECANQLKENLNLNIEQINNTHKIQTQQLVWQENFEKKQLGTFERIIIADCLFFKKYHQALVDTLKELINDIDGEIYIIGPKRGDSSELFIEKASKFFQVQHFEFNDEVYQKQAQQLKMQDQYDPEKQDLQFIKLTLNKNN